MLTAQKVRTWYRIHKWTSLICTSFLLMACVTGLPIVFSDELEEILAPHVTPAPTLAGAPTANLDRMVVEAQEKFPSLHPFGLFWDDDEPRVFVNMSPSAAPKP